MKKNNFFIPQWDKLLIEVDPAFEKIGSIFLPPNHIQKRHSGTVICVGNGKTKEDKIFVNEGDRVLYNIHAGADIKIEGHEGKKFLLMSQEEVLLVYDKSVDLGFRLLTDRIMVEPDKQDFVSPSGLLLPVPIDGISRRGKVVAVGERIKDEMLPLVADDTVHYSANSGSGSIKGEQFGLNPEIYYIIMRPQHIFGKFLTNNND